MITLTLQKALAEDLRVIDLWQTPIAALEPFWQGSFTELEDFTQKYDLLWHEVPSIYEAKIKAAELLQKISMVFKKDIGQFDFRLSTALNAKMLVPINDIEIMHLSIDISSLKEEQKNILTEQFCKYTSRSFLDFRRTSSTTLHFFYSRRGYYDEVERIGIYTSRNSYSIKENFKLAKDNNFILSGLCLSLAQALPDISFAYAYQNGVAGKKEMLITAQDVLEAFSQRQISLSNASNVFSQEQIKEQAKEELKNERQKTRESLPQESLEQRVSEPASTQFRMQLDDSFDDFFAKGFEYYYLKEQEKFHLRLERSKNDSKEAYKYLRMQVDEGVALKEALDLVKQKYRDDDTVNLASLLLTRDILELSSKETQIFQLQERIERNLQDHQKALEDIAKKEQTITTLKSTMTSKINEFNLYKEQAEEQLQQFAQEAKKRMDEELERFACILKEKDESLEAQDILVDRLEIENAHLKQNIDDLKQQILKLEAQLKDIQLENRELYAQVFHIKNQSN